MAFETKGQQIVGGVLGLVFAFFLGTLVVKSFIAMVVCAPQAGKWTPWTGTVCYGEKAP